MVIVSIVVVGAMAEGDGCRLLLVRDKDGISYNLIISVDSLEAYI